LDFNRARAITDSLHSSEKEQNIRMSLRLFFGGGTTINQPETLTCTPNFPGQIVCLEKPQNNTKQLKFNHFIPAREPLPKVTTLVSCEFRAI
jgi:hypothetical protein